MEVENYPNAPITGKTIQDINDGNSTALVISKEFAKELQIENSNMSMSLIQDMDGNKHLLVPKAYVVIVLE
ncbi:MAG: hypothetical protein AB7V56_12215 [Candidatus Nitrosocosmicus sp.]